MWNRAALAARPLPLSSASARYNPGTRRGIVGKSENGKGKGDIPDHVLLRNVRFAFVPFAFAEIRGRPQFVPIHSPAVQSAALQ